MKSISIKEPTIWQLADKIEKLNDMIDGLFEISEAHTKSFEDVGEALEMADKMFTLVEKKIKELDTKCQKLK